MALSYTMKRGDMEPAPFVPRPTSMMAPVSYAPAATVPVAAPVAAPVASMIAPAAVPASTNPFAIDYAQFQAAMAPYAAANNGAYDWTSPEGQNGSVALTLANGKTWTPSGAGSGVTFKPKGTPIMEKDPFQVLGGDSGEEPRMIQVGVTPEDTWTISGDMSKLLGLTDTNTHKTIEYKLQGNQIVPVSESDWQYMSPGASFIDNAGPALAVFAAAAGAASLLGAGGASSAAGAQAAADAGIASGAAADAATMGAVASPVTAGAVEASMLPALAPEVAASTATGFGGVGTDLAVTGAAAGSLAPAEIAALTTAAAVPAVASVAPEVAAGSGMLTGGVSSAPMGFGGAAVSDAALAGVATGTAGLTAAEIAAITGGVGSASGLGATGSGLLSGLGSAIGNGISTVKNAITPITDALGTTPGGLLGTGANLLGGYLNQQAASDAAATQAAAQIEAARIAADAAKFRPVGVSTRFGSSQFGFDPATGYLNSAGYTLSPEMKAQQDALMGVSNNMLTQYQGAQAATAPMGDAAQRMMSLGNQYLATDPQAQAQKYMADQLALLSAGRNTDMANLQAKMQAQGRGGLAIGGGDGMFASNPQLQALLNAQRQQDLGLAAQATQGGMDYAKFGSAMVGGGGDMMNSMYGTQQAAFSPYSTALGGATNIEGLGQNALDMGINLGKTATAANSSAGSLLGQGMANAAQTVGTQAQQAGSPWGNLLQGAAQSAQQYVFNPFTGVRL